MKKSTSVKKPAKLPGKASKTAEKSAARVRVAAGDGFAKADARHEENRVSSFLVKPTPGRAAPSRVVVEPGPVARVEPARSNQVASVLGVDIANPRPPSVVVAPKEERRLAGFTASELMRAPAAEYMSPEQLGFFRERLIEMQNEILENADATSEHLREHEIEPDPTDQATIEEEYALELRARDRERKLLKKIDQALARIADGSYGYCEETGEPIGIPRLLARPTATMSVEAQTRRELKQKLYGD